MGTKQRHQPEQIDVPVPPTGEPRRLPAIIIAAGLLVYFNSFDGVLILDDIYHIWQNPKIRDLSRVGEFLLGDRRPVVTLSLAVNYAIGQLDTWGYHAFNLAVHLAAGLTLFGVVRRTLVHQGHSESCARAAPWLALTIALLWVVHPLQTQSVTYLVQRGESLMGLFYLLTLYCVIRGAHSHRAALWHAAAVGACALGMGSKAVMVTAPVVVLFYDRVFLSPSFAHAFRRRWALYLGLACTWFVMVTTGVAAGVLRPAGTGSATVGFGYKGATPLEYALTQPGVILHYLRLSFWPHPLCLDYQWLIAEGAAAIVPPLSAIVLLLAGTCWALRRRPWLGFVGLWFFVILAPTSSFIPIKDAAFEHRMYLSLASVVVLVVLAGHKALCRLLGGFPPSSWPRRGVAAVVVVLAAAPLGAATFARNAVYHSKVTMYRDVVRQSPHNTRAYVNLGTTLREEGRVEEAMEAYRRALEVDPDFPSALHNLAALHEQKGELSEAFELFKAAVKAEPGRAWRHYNLANCLAKLGRTADAIDAYHVSLSMDPDHFDCRRKLAAALMKRGSVDQAVQEYHKAIYLEPQNQKIRYHLALALRQEGRLEEAVEAFRGLLKLAPSQANARCDLGVTLVQLGRIEQGIEEYRNVIRLKPDHVESHYNLGIALQRQKRFAEAVEEYRAAVRYNPKHANAHCNLGLVLRKMGRIEQAIAAYRQALAHDPSHVAAHHNLGIIWYEQGRLEEAAKQFQAILAVDPANAQARQALGLVRQQQQREKRTPRRPPPNRP